MTTHEAALAALAEAVAETLDGLVDPAALAARLLPVTTLEAFSAGDVLVEQHAAATDVLVLVEGSVTYTHVVSDTVHETVTIEQVPWLPIGWSGLNIRRHRVTATAASDGLLLRLPFKVWDELRSTDPTMWAALIEFALRTATPSLWAVRGVDRPTTEPASTLAADLPASAMAVEELRDMYRQSTALGGLPSQCREWLADHTQLYVSEPDRVVLREGAPSDGLWLLFNGRVQMTFALVDEEDAANVRTTHAVRSAVRSGTLLALAGAAGGMTIPFDVTTTRVTRLAHVPSEALHALAEEHPRWAGALVGQELWQLRNWLTWTRSRFGMDPDDDGITAVGHLIEDSGPTLPVNSTLYGVTHLLQHHLTREDGFRRLYAVQVEGTSAERAVASTALDLLRDLERGHRFFLGLKTTYDAVVASDALSPAERRRVSTRHFRDALDHVPWVIKGLEHLPDDPNFILVYNHMAYAEDSVLPNGFLFNPDSHFISGILLEPRYGDGIRVARTNAATEFWRADYYDRLGHIPVTTPESGWIEETPEEKAARKQQFFDDCADVLARGTPFSIAPEGTITEEDSVTARSPGPLKPGAFLLSERLPSRPRILPVALANFDEPAHSAVFACVIKPPFSMADRGVDTTDRDAMAAFLESYRREFRTHVEEAIALAEDVVRPDAALDDVVTNLGAVDVVHEEFEHDVRSLELRPTPPGLDREPTVFFGSSTFRLWTSAGDDVGVPRALNLSFGGSTLEACRRYFERLVVPYRPARLLLYAGDNDIGRGVSAAELVDLFEQFADTVRTHCPTTRCWFVSIKPSPSRDEFTDTIRAANEGVATIIEERDEWRYVDWFQHLLGPDGRADRQFFQPDELHVNEAAYAILARLLEPELSARV
jgi:CRP-like cAMP-binding protein/lysophospholipase L1-like esterase